MKAWRPAHPPSNRDRLELYALHKQAVSSDIPSSHNTSGISIPEKAKVNAWRSKKGIPRGQAMILYIQECDRQWRVYGSAPSPNNNNLAVKQVTSPAPGTPNNTPAVTKNVNNNAENAESIPNNSIEDSNTNQPDPNAVPIGGGNVLLTPRGLAAIPLLSAAAAEPRGSYLTRLRNTPITQGWWAKQEPLCSDPGTLLAFPETILLYVASTVEWFSLRLENRAGWDSGAVGTDGQVQHPSTLRPSTFSTSLFPPSIIQSFLWPLHNVLLSIWIVLIFLSTILSTTLLSLRAILFGSPYPLSSIFAKEILPASKAAASLCDYYQAVSIRVTGLMFMPYVTICQLSYGIAGSNSGVSGSVSFSNNSNTGGLGLWIGAVCYCTFLGFSWWYWAFIVPWCAFAGIFIGLSCGWCFALIEMAGITSHE